MGPATITRKGRRYVLVPIEDYERMAKMAPWPPVAPDGTSDAIEFARASIARTLLRDRSAAGLSQQALAELAGVRQETISRIESGRHTASVRVIDKLNKAIHAALRRRRRQSR
jgi:ribosome-binding protein aMBF1 (putative translation factor)